MPIPSSSTAGSRSKLTLSPKDGTFSHLKTQSLLYRPTLRSGLGSNLATAPGFEILGYADYAAGVLRTTDLSQVR
jgi:hypothetical protein